VQEEKTMTIRKTGSEIVPPAQARDAASRQQKSGEGSTERARRRGDRPGSAKEGISLVGWARGVDETSSPERLVLIRSGIALGYYDDPAVAHEVARRMIASGDLDPFTPRIGTEEIDSVFMPGAW
jgi:hypothetical protein